MSEPLDDYILSRLTKAREAGLGRSLRVVEALDGPEVVIDSKTCVSFASNDYLGLSRHPDVKAAAKAAVEKYGAGAGASRLIIGDLALHHELEERIARFKGREAARVFATGYLANIGAICALVGPGDAVVSDEKNHSSIIDACRLSGAKILVYRHLDLDSLRARLEEARGCRNTLVVTESVFSIDGDIAPVGEIAKLAKEFGAWSMIDEAHATGIIGPRGRGAEELFECTGQVDVVMGTLSKAVASQGGFIAGDADLSELFINISRAFIYSTGLAPAAAAAAAESLAVMGREPHRRVTLFENIGRVNEMTAELGLRETPSQTPIIPLTIGDEKEAVSAFESLWEKGLVVPVMRYPTVPKGEACLRISVSCDHTPEHLSRLGNALKDLRR